MIQKTPRNTKVFFPNLDGIRLLAFLFVYVSHSFLPTIGRTVNNTYVDLFKFHSVGPFGVSAFFVLSGFLITYLLLKEEELTGKINVGFFYIRRLLRIWPLYFAVVIFGLFIFPFIKIHLGNNAPIASRNPLYYLFFLGNFDLITQWHLNLPFLLLLATSWSVAVEEQFYLIWPLLFLLVPKTRYVYIFYLIIAFSVIFRFIYRDDVATLNFHSVSSFGDLAVGGLCGYYSFYSERFLSLFEKFSKPAISVTYIAGLLWMFACGHLTGRLVTTLFFAFIILEQNFSKNSFYKFGNNMFFTFWGKYTYGLYLLHTVCLWITESLIYRIFLKYDSLRIRFDFLKDIVALPLTFLAAYVSYEYFENVFLKFKDKFSFVRR